MGIEFTTCQFVAYCLNHYTTERPLTEVSITTEVIMHVSLCRSVSTYQPTRHHIPEDYNLDAS